MQGWVRVCGEFGSFFEDALDGGRFSVKHWDRHGIEIGRGEGW